MNQRSLLYFLTTAEERNMTQAAKKLFISQQTLSSAIQRLEKEYHTQFFPPGSPSPADRCRSLHGHLRPGNAGPGNKPDRYLDEVAQNLRGILPWASPLSAPG